MDQQTLLTTVMTAFVIIAAVALIIQAAMLAGIYKTSRGLQQNVQKLACRRSEGVLETCAPDHRGQPQTNREDITSKTSEILETTRKQMHRDDEFMDDAASRARACNSIAPRWCSTTRWCARSAPSPWWKAAFWKPIVQIQGVAAGIKTAISVLLRGRPNPERRALRRRDVYLVARATPLDNRLR